MSPERFPRACGSNSRLGLRSSESASPWSRERPGARAPETPTLGRLTASTPASPVRDENLPWQAEFLRDTVRCLRMLQKDANPRPPTSRA